MLLDNSEVVARYLFLGALGVKKKGASVKCQSNYYRHVHMSPADWYEYLFYMPLFAFFFSPSM